MTNLKFSSFDALSVKLFKTITVTCYVLPTNPSQMMLSGSCIWHSKYLWCSLQDVFVTGCKPKGFGWNMFK